MRREYYIHKRKNGIFYVEFVNPENGEKLSAKSTGETDRLKAQVKAEIWKQSGLPTGRKGKLKSFEEVSALDAVTKIIRKASLNSDDAFKIVEMLKNMGLIEISAVSNTGQGSVQFIQFLETFWDYDKSEYIKDKLSHGHRFTKRYAKTRIELLNKHLKPFFNDKKLNMITTEDLEKLTNFLSDSGFSTSTIKQVVLIAQTPLKWAYNKKIISNNPTQGLTKFSIVNKERGILTEKEAAALFFVKWDDKRAFVCSILSCTTAARLSECLALRKSDLIGIDTINILHSYSPVDGLKCPKNGEKRKVFLLPEIRELLLDLLNENPHKIDDPFIFYSKYSDRPVVPNVILKGLKDAMDKVNKKYQIAAKKENLNKPEISINYKDRNITFHSWRHYFCSKITEQIEGEKVAKVSGHLSENVFKRYADHIETKNLIEVGNAAAHVFKNIVPFQKTG